MGIRIGEIFGTPQDPFACIAKCHWRRKTFFGHPGSPPTPIEPRPFARHLQSAAGKTPKQRKKN